MSLGFFLSRPTRLVSLWETSIGCFVLLIDKQHKTSKNLYYMNLTARWVGFPRGNPPRAIYVHICNYVFLL